MEEVLVVDEELLAEDAVDLLVLVADGREDAGVCDGGGGDDL